MKREQGARGTLQRPTRPLRPNEWVCARCARIHDKGVSHCVHCALPAPQPAWVAAGDWQCTGCGSWIWASKPQCEKCHSLGNWNTMMRPEEVWECRACFRALPFATQERSTCIRIGKARRSKSQGVGRVIGRYHAKNDDGQTGACPATPDKHDGARPGLFTCSWKCGRCDQSNYADSDPGRNCWETRKGEPGTTEGAAMPGAGNHSEYMRANPRNPGNQSPGSERSMARLTVKWRRMELGRLEPSSGKLLDRAEPELLVVPTN